MSATRAKPFPAAGVGDERVKPVLSSRGDDSSETAPLKVLYVIDSLATGGAERSLAAISPRLLANGLDLTVLCLQRRDGLRPALEAAGATVVELGPGNRRSWPGQVTAAIRSADPHLVHTTLFEANQAGRVAARRAGVPVVSSIVNATYGPDHTGDPGLHAWKVRACQLTDMATARLVTRFHAVSYHVAQVMARRLRLDPGRIDVVPRGRDPVALGRRTADRRVAARARLGLAERTEVVLAVARQEHQKGLDVLLAAAARLTLDHSDIVVLVAGREGAATDRLRKDIDRLGLGSVVRLLGDRDDVPDLLCAADVFALPSRREGMPGALLEAMALEVPAVVTALPQLREVVDESSAWLVPPEDPEMLGAALAQALRRSTAVEWKVGAARRRFESEYTIDAVAEATVAFYRRALGRA
jgi:glycosyltransferase involved in cell wall biosynthesis